MTGEESRRVHQRLDALGAEIAELRADIQRTRNLLDGHMDVRALDPGGHLQHYDDWSPIEDMEDEFQ